MLTITSLPNIILGVYGILFSTLVFLTETQLFFFRTLIAVNYGFLFHPILRLLFYVLLASVAWSYESILGYASAGCVLGCAVYNTFVLVKYPEYKIEKDRIAAEEDHVIERRIREEVRNGPVERGGGSNVIIATFVIVFVRLTD